MTAKPNRRRSGGPSGLVIITAASATAFIILLAVFALQLIGDSGTMGPRLQVDREKIDLGRIEYDKTVRAVFTIKNVGDRPLQLRERQITTRAVEGC